MWSEWTLITPELARDWLQHGPTHRTDPELVCDHVRRMRSGSWRDHWGLLWSDKSRLLDGRHRLEAVAEAGVSVWMMVTYGVDDDLVLDEGCRLRR